MRVFSLLKLFLLLFFLSVVVASTQNNNNEDSVLDSVLVMDSTLIDSSHTDVDKLSQARAERLMHKVFNRNFHSWANHELIADDTCLVNWVEWENVYFQRKYFLRQLASYSLNDWTEGIWWWQISVDMEYEKFLKRGDPVRFILHFPFVDFRDDLVITATKTELGETIIVINSGGYYPRRWSYFTSFLIMLITLLVFLLLVVVVLYILFSLSNYLVDWVADYVTQGNGQNKWARRFAASIIGAFIMFVFGVIVLFI